MFVFQSIARKCRLPLVTRYADHIYRCRVCRAYASQRSSLKEGPNLAHFMAPTRPGQDGQVFISKRDSPLPQLNEDDLQGNGAKVLIRTYGCQMNVNDSAIAETILRSYGYQLVEDVDEAEIVLLMTCAIREGAETKVWSKLKELAKLKASGRIRQIGLLGCVAERVKTEALERHREIDIIAGPDSYRRLPELLAVNRTTGQSAVNVLLSLDETYSDVMPTMTSGSVTAFVSIMRGCDNMCSYCIVPFTRGRERSRPLRSIVDEVRRLSDSGIKEVTLLGQNVNSYRDLSSDECPSARPSRPTSLVAGFKTVYKPRSGGLTFDVLLEAVAEVNPNLRVRFTSPHPKDFDDRVLDVIAGHPNICNSIHLPVQSGSNEVLARMRRGYTREAYLSLVDRIRHVIPDCALSSDFICGFCGETEAEHQQTVDLMGRVGYNSAFTFAYSMRRKTHAFHTLSDDVPIAVKVRRLQELNGLYREVALKLNRSLVGAEQLVLIEGQSKKTDRDLFGRNEANLKVIVPKMSVPDSDGTSLRPIAPGDYVVVRIRDCSAITLMAEPVRHKSLSDYYNK